MGWIKKTIAKNPVTNQVAAAGDSSLGIITVFFKELLTTTRELYKLLRERERKQSKTNQP